MEPHVTSASEVPVSAAVEASWWPHQPSNNNTTVSSVSTNGDVTRPGAAVGPTQVQTPTTTSNATAPRASISVACVACRSRHLKCDGGNRCSRCKADGVHCSYVKSRRGWKPLKRKPKTASTPQSERQPALGQSNGSLLPSPLESVLGLNVSQESSPSFNFASDVTLLDTTLGAPNGLNFEVSAPSNQLSFGVAHHPGPGSVSPLGAFFAFFFPSHSFVLPRKQLIELFKERRAPHLELAIQYIGSCFIPSAPTQMFKETLNRMLFHQNVPKDGFSVQAMLLFAVGLHANCEQDKAGQVLQLAINLALEIGLNRVGFAILHGSGDRVMEESWKRTWWSLFVINGLFAGVNPSIAFRLRDVASDVPLPCEESEYLSGQIPFSRSIQEYDDASFAVEEMVFSSFTYLIDAVRVMGKVLEVSRADSLEYQSVTSADACLVNWTLHLPPNKRDIVANDGQIDEVLFQAHMIICATTILLHRPRSNLGFGEVEEVTTCVTPGQCLLPAQTREIHTAKSLQAAEDISKLITLPTSLQKHTPFFTCVVVMASVVHLSYWSFMVPDGQDEKIKSLIRLDTGVLQTLSVLWPVANTVLRQVRGVAHVMFKSKKAMSIHLWSSIANDDVIRGLIDQGAHEDPALYSALLTP
ncbi:hypothetical protein AOQ84DRAFT_315728 [Glonium stellatum]|uniref:Zn(2)-C6 fungal-type domain-containing protein n=1 Tax=Glonium stellatum TaxID=574774 RepID=A0A8E2F478_9PEZI|nr:hypothetical protein AOQ84DRAFT_315728 [Glonium stellatum]